MKPSRTLGHAPLFGLITAPIVFEIALARRAGLPFAAAALAPEVTGIPPFGFRRDL